MDDKLVHKFFNKFKDKFTKNKTTYHESYEYAFSSEELENINKQNKQKIQELKQDIFSTNKKDNNDKPKTEEVLSSIETKVEPITTPEIKEPSQDDPPLSEQPVEQNIQELPRESEEESKELKPQNSFINLNPEHQQLISTKWNEIKSNKIDKDIINGKDLLNHNYTITYADDAARFIHYIRKEYEIVICYLIGFNNEKQGIYDKTFFSKNIDDEWKYLSNYIKLLEKIRNFKK